MIEYDKMDEDGQIECDQCGNMWHRFNVHEYDGEALCDFCLDYRRDQDGYDEDEEEDGEEDQAGDQEVNEEK